MSDDAGCGDTGGGDTGGGDTGGGDAGCGTTGNTDIGCTSAEGTDTGTSMTCDTSTFHQSDSAQGGCHNENISGNVEKSDSMFCNTEDTIHYELNALPIDEINTVYYPHQHPFHQHHDIQRMGNHFSNRSSNITYSSPSHSSYPPNTEQFRASIESRRVCVAMGLIAFSFGIMFLIGLLFFLTKSSFRNS